MTKPQLIETLATLKAKAFLSATPEQSGLLDFLKDGFTGLKHLPEDQLQKIYDDMTIITKPIETKKEVAELTPKDFMNKVPSHSVLLQPQFETIARNIMVILYRTGNKFRELSWSEYVKERTKDKNFSESEKEYFLGVAGYCKSAEVAVLLSPEWAALKN